VELASREDSRLSRQAVDHAKLRVFRLLPRTTALMSDLHSHIPTYCDSAIALRGFCHYDAVYAARERCLEEKSAFDPSVTSIYGCWVLNALPLLSMPNALPITPSTHSSQNSEEVLEEDTKRRQKARLTFAERDSSTSAICESDRQARTRCTHRVAAYSEICK
jgi:hypothetical protein